MTPEKRWKAQERRVARLMRAKRNPSDGTGKPDAESDWLTIENKDRKQLPQWIVAALAKVRAKAFPKKLGLLTITTAESPLVLVIMDMRDFRAWFGKG